MIASSKDCQAVRAGEWCQPVFGDCRSPTVCFLCCFSDCLIFSFCVKSRSVSGGCFVLVTSCGV